MTTKKQEQAIQAKRDASAEEDARRDIENNIAKARNPETPMHDASVPANMKFYLRVKCVICFAVVGVPCSGASSRPCLERIISATNSMKEQGELWARSEYRRRRPMGVM